MGALETAARRTFATVVFLLLGFPPAPACSESSPARVTIRLESAAVVCTVPRDVRNRWLTITIEDVTSHLVQIDGEDGPVTSRLEYRSPLECPDGAEETHGVLARCDLASQDGHFQAATKLLCR